APPFGSGERLSAESRKFFGRFGCRLRLSTYGVPSRKLEFLAQQEHGHALHFHFCFVHSFLLALARENTGGLQRPSRERKPSRYDLRRPWLPAAARRGPRDRRHAL